MRKRLVRKTFDMIQDIAESDNKEVRMFSFGIGFEGLYFVNNKNN